MPYSRCFYDRQGSIVFFTIAGIGACFFFATANTTDRYFVITPAPNLSAPNATAPQQICQESQIWPEAMFTLGSIVVNVGSQVVKGFVWSLLTKYGQLVPGWSDTIIVLNAIVYGLGRGAGTTIGPFLSFGFALPGFLLGIDVFAVILVLLLFKYLADPSCASESVEEPVASWHTDEASAIAPCSPCSAVAPDAELHASAAADHEPVRLAE